MMESALKGLGVLMLLAGVTGALFVIVRIARLISQSSGPDAAK